LLLRRHKDVWQPLQQRSIYIKERDIRWIGESKPERKADMLKKPCNATRIICDTHDCQSDSFYLSAKGLLTDPNEYKVLLQGFFSISASQ